MQQPKQKEDILQLPSLSVATGGAVERKEEKTEIKSLSIKLIHAAGSYPATSGARLTAAQKLLALRQYMLEDSFITEELTYYVPPNGQSLLGNEVVDPLQPWVEKTLKESETRVVLLKGPGGAGKSTFNRHLLRALWQDLAWQSWRPGDAPPVALAPLFIPLGSSTVDPKHLLAYLSNLPAPLDSFSEEEINVLKADYALLLIADGYDEIPGQAKLNLYDVNQLGRYEGRVKLLISSRILEGRERVETSMFVPHRADSEAILEWRYFKERYLAPFNDGQIESYLREYLKKNQHRTDITLWPDVARYQQQFVVPELRDLISTPFLLWMAAEVLPSIAKEVEAVLPKLETKQEIKGSETKPQVQAQRQLLTRMKLYHHFMLQWFSRQAQKAVSSGDILRTPEIVLGDDVVETITRTTTLTGDRLAAELLQQSYRRFCQTLSMNLQTENRVSVQYPVAAKHRRRIGQADVETKSSEAPASTWIETLFGSQDPDWVRVRKGCPLRHAQNEHSFINASLIDYFVATVIAEQASATQPVMEIETKSASSVITTLIPKLTEQKELALSSIQSMPVVRARRKACIGTANNEARDLILQYLFPRSTLQLSADAVKENNEISQSLRHYYDGLIERSKTDESVAVGAANAISILNAAGENFSSKDFSKVRIPGADLSGALLDRTNFSDSDLHQVSLQGAWAPLADFKRAKLSELRFGEEPFINLGTKVSVSALSFDNRQLAISLKSYIMIYDLESRRCVRCCMGHNSNVLSLSWNRLGDQLASGSEDQTVRVWDVMTGRELCRFSSSASGGLGEVRSVSWSPQGNKIISGSKFSVRIWEIESGNNFELLGHANVSSVAWDAKGELIASGSWDNSIQVWDAKTGKRLRKFIGHAGRIGALAWDPIGRRLVSGGWDNTVRIWDMLTGKELISLAASKGFKRAGMLSYLSNYIGVDQKEMKDRELNMFGRGVKAIAWDHSGQRIGFGCEDDSICVWDTITRKELRRFIGHSDQVNSITWDLDSRRLISTGGEVRIWNVDVNTELHPRSKDTYLALDARWDDAGKRFASIYEGEAVSIWDVDKKKELFHLTMFIRFVTWGPNGDMLASISSDDKSIKIWSVETGVEIACFTNNRSGEIRCIAWNIHQGCLAFLSLDKKNKDKEMLIGIDVDTGEELFQIIPPLSVQWLSWDRSGKRLAAGGMEGMCVWEMITQDVLALQTTYRFDEVWADAGVTSPIAWDPSGERIALSGPFDHIKIWDVIENKELSQLKTRIIRSMAWDFTSNRLASGGADKIVSIWDVTTGVRLFQIDLPEIITSLAWRPGAAESILAVTFGSNIACYKFGIDNKVVLYWLNSPPSLYLNEVNMTGALGLEPINALLLREKYAVGLLPETIVMSEAEKNYYLGEEKHLADQDYLLGVSYQNGYGVVINLHKAFLYFYNAAYQKHSRAQYYAVKLGKEKQFDDSYFSKDYEAEYQVQSFGLIRQQAQSKKDAWAALTLANMYRFAFGTPRHIEAASEWYRVAVPLLMELANQGVRQAQVEIGTCYKESNVLEKDSKKAAFWYSVAAKQDYAIGHALLGRCYEDGFGVAEDLKAAVDEYYQAAAQGQWTVEEDLAKLSLAVGNIRQATSVKEFPLAVAEQKISASQFTVDGRRIGIAFGLDIFIYDTAFSKRIALLSGHKAAVRSLCWDRQGQRLISASDDRTVRVWDVLTQKQLRSWTIETRYKNSQPTAVAWDPFRFRVASGSDDGVVQIWDASKGAFLRKIEFPEDEILALSWDLCGERLAISFRISQQIRVWDTSKKLQEWREINNFTLKENVISLVWDHAGKQLAAGCEEGVIKILDTRTGKLQYELQGHTQAVNSLYWDSLSKFLITSGLDGTVRIWNIKLAKPIPQIIKLSEGVLSLSWDAQHEQMIAYTKDNLIYNCDEKPSKLADLSNIFAKDLKAEKNQSLYNLQNIVAYAAPTMSKTEARYYIGEDAHLFDQDYLKGIQYRRGYGVQIDNQLALKAFKQAANNGHPRAQFYLGVMYEQGEGTEKNQGEAKKLYQQCFPIIQKQAQSDPNVWAIRNLAIMYRSGDGVTRNLDLAVSLYQRALPLLMVAAQQGVIDAILSLAIYYSTWQEGIENEVEYLRWVRVASELGSAKAQFDLNFCFETGYGGVVHDLQQSIAWLRLAADQGLESATKKLQNLMRLSELNDSELLETSSEDKEDKEAKTLPMMKMTIAEEQYYLGAEQHSADRDYLKGISYYQGYGVKIDLSIARSCFQKAADLGHARAQYSLGLIYDGGEGITEDKFRAKELYSKSLKGIQRQLVILPTDAWALFSLAVKEKKCSFNFLPEASRKTLYPIIKTLLLSAKKQGIIHAYIALASWYERGEGIEQDFKEAFNNYKLAAEQGCALAQCVLGAAYRQGEIIEKDLVESVKWFRESAYRGYGSSQGWLGYFYEEGIEVEQSFSKALYWYGKASQQNQSLEAPWFKSKLINLRQTRLNLKTFLVPAASVVSKEDLEQLQGLYQTANLSFKEGNLNEAIEVYEAASTFRGGSSDLQQSILANLARAYFVRGQQEQVQESWQQAEQTFEKAMEIKPSMNTYCEYGHFLYFKSLKESQNHKLKIAVKILTDALSLEEKENLSYRWLDREIIPACLQSLIGKPEDSLEVSPKLLAQYLLVSGWCNLDQLQEAKTALTKLEKITSDHPNNNVAAQLLAAAQMEYVQCDERFAAAKIASSRDSSNLVKNNEIKQVGPLASAESVSLFAGATSQLIKEISDLLNQVYPSEDMAHFDMRNIYLAQLAEFQQRRNNLSAQDTVLLRQLLVELKRHLQLKQPVFQKSPTQ